jgi:hypothetical protein
LRLWADAMPVETSSAVAASIAAYFLMDSASPSSSFRAVNAGRE